MVFSPAPKNRHIAKKTMLFSSNALSISLFVVLLQIHPLQSSPPALFLLNHPLVKPERVLQASNPILAVIDFVDAWERISASFYNDAIPLLQHNTLLPIETNTRSTPSVPGYVTPKDAVVRKDHTPKAQYVGTDRREENARDGRVYDGTSGGHAVRSTTRRGSKDNSISLYVSEIRVITIRFDIR